MTDTNQLNLFDNTKDTNQDNNQNTNQDIAKENAKLHIEKTLEFFTNSMREKLYKYIELVPEGEDVSSWETCSTLHLDNLILEAYLDNDHVSVANYAMFAYIRYLQEQ